MQFPEIFQDFIIATATAGVTWFFSRQKQKADIKTAELDNVEKAIQIWRALAQDLGKKVDDLTSKCDGLSMEIDALRTENRSLKSSLAKAIRTYEK